MSQMQFRITSCTARAALYAGTVVPIGKRYLRRNADSSTFAKSSTLIVLAAEQVHWTQQCNKLLDRSNRIAATDFMFNFNRFSDREALLHFRFRVADICALIQVLGWPSNQALTRRNRHSVQPVLATCIILRRMSVPDRWEDICGLSGKHPSQLSEIFWEGMDHFMSKSGRLLLSSVPSSYLERRVQPFSEAVREKGSALTNCVGFIYGTVLGVPRPKRYMKQMVVYNGHKRKHALKYQGVTTPDGMVLHAYGPVEGRRHDWFMYTCSGIESIFGNILLVDGKQYVLYGDSGYNWREFMEVPFQGSNLNVNQKAFNKSMSKVRVTVEWIFKEVKLYFPVCDTKRKMKPGESPVGLLYLGTMLMCNLHSCCYPNQISRCFGVTPPSLQEYISTRNGVAS